MSRLDFSSCQSTPQPAVVADRGCLRALAVGLLAMLVLGLSSCSEEVAPAAGSPAAAPSPKDLRLAVQERVEREFQLARQLMPKDVQPDVLSSTLAPLFFVEGARFPRFGVLSEGRASEIVPGPMTLYVRESKGYVGGAERRIISFVWWENLGEHFRPQGVRMVLGERAMPRLFEVLSDSSKSRVFYVSARVEQLTKDKFGSVAQGRKFHVEQESVPGSQAIVARILDDSPMPLGPWAYMESLSGDVMSLICRCMPSQLKGPVERQDYVLVPWPRDAAVLFPFDALPVNGEASIDSLLRLAGL